MGGSQNLENIIELKKKQQGNGDFFRENHFNFLKDSKNDLYLYLQFPFPELKIFSVKLS